LLNNAPALSGFSVADIDRARDFYGQTLGLEVAEIPLGTGPDVPHGLELRLAAGTRIRIYPKADHQPATFTILTFLVPDIDAAVDELVGRGVRFEHYTTGTPTDARGIHRNPSVQPVAWFKDPAGNTLSLNEDTAGSLP
jgi:catechol 2,3-dioxygenase-like lactoylglutathione lyase family enzyme